MAIINRSSITALLRPGIDTVFADYGTYGDIWKPIYSIRTSNKQNEVDLEMMGLGLAALKQDGSPVAMGQMQQGYQTEYFHNFYGLGFQITRAAIEDNLYQDQFPKDAEQLKSSLQTLRNYNAMVPFNGAFSSFLVSDGQPLCSIAHPINNGTLANTFTNGVGLNESAIEDGMTIIKSFRNLGGLNIDRRAMRLLVPNALWFKAKRILHSTGQTGTGNNDINVINYDKLLPDGAMANTFLTNPGAWFMITDEAEGFKWFQRSPVDINFSVDATTDNTTIRAVERYSNGCSNWRAVFGSSGAI